MLQAIYLPGSHTWSTLFQVRAAVAPVVHNGVVQPPPELAQLSSAGEEEEEDSQTSTEEEEDNDLGGNPGAFLSVEGGRVSEADAATSDSDDTADSSERAAGAAARAGGSDSRLTCDLWQLSKQKRPSTTASSDGGRRTHLQAVRRHDHRWHLACILPSVVQRYRCGQEAAFVQLRAQLTQNLSKDRPHTSPMSPVSDGDVLKDGGGESWLSRYDDATSPPPPPQDTRPRTPTIIPIRTAATGAPAPATPASQEAQQMIPQRYSAPPQMAVFKGRSGLCRMMSSPQLGGGMRSSDSFISVRGTATPNPSPLHVFLPPLGSHHPG